MRSSVLLVVLTLVFTFVFSIALADENLDNAATDAASAKISPAVSVLIQEQVMSGYVYQPTGETISRKATSELDTFVTLGKFSGEFYRLDSLGNHPGGYHETEFNVYYATPISKTPLSLLLTSGIWRESGGYIVPLYGELSHDFSLDHITISPFAGYGQWFGFGKELDLGYLQGGARFTGKLFPRVTLSVETAYSHCFHEVTRSGPQFVGTECRTVAYANGQLAYDLGAKFTLQIGVTVTESSPTFFGIALRRSF